MLLLPFAQYNLQCPGYYLPKSMGTPTALAIFGTKLFRTLQSRRPTQGWAGCGAGGRCHFFGALAKVDLSSSIALASREFLPNRVSSLNIRPSVTYRQRPFCKIPNIRFFFVYQSLCLTFCVGVACLGKKRNFSSLGGACYAHKTNGAATFLGDQCD